MVVAVGKTTTHQLDGALEALETVGSKVAGVVLTMVPTKGADAYSYGYGYGYGGYGVYQPEASKSTIQKLKRRKDSTVADSHRRHRRGRQQHDQATSFDDLLDPH